MAHRVMLLLFSLALQGAFRAVAAWDAEAEQGACGPDCHGECFAGECLFQADGLDKEGQGRAASPAAAPTGRGAADEALAPLPQRGRFFDRRGLPFDRRSKGLLTASDTADVVGVPTLDFEENPDPDVRVSALQSMLAAAQSTDASISEQNEMLQKELSAWRKAGSIVARHEANLMGFMQHARAKDESSENISSSTMQAGGTDVAAGGEKMDPLGLLSDAVMTHVFNAGRAPLDDTSNAHRLLLIFFIVNTLVFVAFTVSQNAKTMFASKSRLRHGSAATKLDRLMSRRPAPKATMNGPDAYTIAISDIQVGNLVVAGEICVSVKTPESGRALRTEPIDSCAHLLSFREIFKFSFASEGRDGSKCVFTVIDTEAKPEETIAYCEMSTEAISRLACSEYVTLDLVRPGGTFPDWAGTPGEQRRRPYLSMRITRAVGAVGADAL